MMERTVLLHLGNCISEPLHVCPPALPGASSLWPDKKNFFTVKLTSIAFGRTVLPLGFPHKIAHSLYGQANEGSGSDRWLNWENLHKPGAKTGRQRARSLLSTGKEQHEGMMVAVSGACFHDWKSTEDGQFSFQELSTDIRILSATQQEDNEEERRHRILQLRSDSIIFINQNIVKASMPTSFRGNISRLCLAAPSELQNPWRRKISTTRASNSVFYLGDGGLKKQLFLLLQTTSLGGDGELLEINERLSWSRIIQYRQRVFPFIQKAKNLIQQKLVLSVITGTYPITDNNNHG